MSDFPPIAFVIPHQEPMVLLDRIVDWSPGRIECALRVQDGARFVADGLLLVPLTIEHMAQAVAAMCTGAARSR
jgi:predicted hotdog family 3-hydroxylacyl-ACP dehydratase